jgi:hypothetical protein
MIPSMVMSQCLAAFTCDSQVAIVTTSFTGSSSLCLAKCVKQFGQQCVQLQHLRPSLAACQCCRPGHQPGGLHGSVRKRLPWSKLL